MKTLQSKKLLLVLGLVLAFTLYTLTPFVFFHTGNIFFGKVSSLYNVRLAQLCFQGATSPLLLQEPMFANYQLSRTYFIQGKLDTALFYAQRELELYPENKRTYYILGLTLGYMNREEEAIDAFGKFIEWKPSTWAGRNDKAWLEFRIGRIDDAITTMTPITVYTDNPWIQNTYGTLLLNKGKYDEAKIAFTYAQRITDAMTEETWGKAYPGNDPRIYGTGLRAMKLSIANNLELIKKEQEKK